MTPRMEKLQRQRALLHEHLRWLDSEIAAEASAVPAPARPRDPEPPPPPVMPSEPPASAPASDAPAVEIPEPNVIGIHNEVRGGCLLYFGLACLAVGLAIAFIYWRY